jgi:uncharacterized membrane protein YphA (DoxX/SURF4 family)
MKTLSAFTVAGVGLFLLILGWQGWSRGEIVVNTKGLPSFIAAATGPQADIFLWKVGGYLVTGGVLLFVGVAMLHSLWQARRKPD